MRKNKKLLIISILCVLLLLPLGCNNQTGDVTVENSEKNTGTTECSSIQEETESTMEAEIYKVDPNVIPDVYMTTEISPESLIKIYKALGKELPGKVGVKISTGEPGSNYLKADLIGDLVKSLNGTIVECNTAYAGSRSSTKLHKQVAKDHGYYDIADVDIMDEDASMSIPVYGGTHIKENLVGSHFTNYDSFLVLSHFKGHTMAGLGGAIKNTSIGFASAEGKSLIHTGGRTDISTFQGKSEDFLESMGEAAKSVSDYMDHGQKLLYINVMNRLSVSCDCETHPVEPKMADIGILASTDPVALDQACVDLIYSGENNEDMIERIESRNGLLTLEHAEAIGLGNRKYNLVSIDD